MLFLSWDPQAKLWSQTAHRSTRLSVFRRCTPSKKDSLTRRTLGGFFWIASSSALQSVLRVLVVAVLARLLTPEDFGLMSAAAIVIGLADVLQMLGIGAALVQLPHITAHHVDTGFTASVFFGVLLGGLVWLFGAPVAALFQMPGLEPLLSLLAWIFPLKAVSQVSAMLLQRDLRYRKLAGVDVISYVVGYGAVGLILAYLGFGVWALVWAALAQALTFSIVLFKLQPHPVRPRIFKEAFKDLLKFGLGVTTANIFNFVALRGDNFVVARWLGAGALGIYGRAYGLMNSSNSLVGAVMNKVLFPAFSKLQGNADRLAVAFRRGVALVALLSLPVGTACLLLAPELVDVLLGQGWEEVVLPFQILAVGMLFRLGHKVSGALANGCGAAYNHAWRQAIYAVLVVGGAMIGQNWGIAGVACSTIGALAVNFALVMQLGLTLTGLTWRDLLQAHVPAVASSLVVGVQVWVGASVLRSWDVPAFLILLPVSLASFAMLLALARVAPKLLLGVHGLWLFEKVVEQLPAGKPGLLRKTKMTLGKAFHIDS